MGYFAVLTSPLGSPAKEGLDYFSPPKAGAQTNPSAFRVKIFLVNLSRSFSGVRAELKTGPALSRPDQGGAKYPRTPL
jgi:hypothetical protein